MDGEKKTSLFREKSLEAIESPESLNDYLRVTSPGVWLVMGAVIALLAGLIIWGIFGRIDTKQSMAVVCEDGQAVCYVPFDKLEAVMNAGSVTVNGVAYEFSTDQDVSVNVVTEDMSAYIRVAGNLLPGDMTVQVPVESLTEDGIYTGVAVTESLMPFSLLFQ